MIPVQLLDPVCVPDRHAVIPGGGPVGAVAPPPVPQVRRRTTTGSYTLITQRRSQHAVGYRASVVAIAGSSGLFLATGWLVAVAVAVAATTITAVAALGRRHQPAGRTAITHQASYPRLELTG